jgi:hypothetical protein
MIDAKHKWFMAGVVVGMLALYIWQMRTAPPNES